MRAGELIDGRFELLAEAGAGGMGVVYRAVDHQGSRVVAVKVLAEVGDELVKRFLREVRIMATLSHPAIVGYVAHGATRDGRPYLAMEWLEGRDLASVLAERALDPAQTVLVAKRVLAGLAAAHAQGVLHRDVKPSNLYLVDADPAQTKVLDFGIAAAASLARLTATGAMLGSMGYMPPEQLSGARLDERADLFALGCVLHECLTGAPAFEGPHQLARAVATMLGERRALATHAPGVPTALAALVDRMVAGDAAQRPRSAAEVLAALDALGTLADAPPPTPRPARRSFGDVEQRMVSIVLVRAQAPAPESAGEAVIAGQSTVVTEAAPTVSAVVEPLGGVALAMPGGEHLVLLNERRAARDDAAMAARCALRIAAALPDAMVAVATGPARLSGQAAAGPVLDRALALLGSPRSALTPGGVRLDALTAGLLGDDFEVSPGREGDLWLVGRSAADPPSERTIAGRATPFVGRERELSHLENAVLVCAEERRACAILVVGDAGAGKSRLRRELWRRLASAPEPPRCLLARGDPTRGSTSGHVVAELVRAACGEPATLAALVAHLRAAGVSVADEVAEILAELAGIAPDRAVSAALRAARAEPQTMVDLIRGAFDFWITALARQPLLLFIEDLHLADATSLELLARALDRAADLPLCVLGMTRDLPGDRPAAQPRFVRDAERLELRRLGRASVERVLRAALPEASPQRVAQIVERADGNPFYLEELVRHVATRGDDALPETVLAMAQSVLDTLAPDARTVLRAAAVVGETFWAGAVERVAQGAIRGGSVAHWLRALLAQQIVVPREPSRFAGEPEYAFRTTPLREAVYATVVEPDRGAAHRHALEWLESVGERDGALLAEHRARAREASDSGGRR